MFENDTDAKADETVSRRSVLKTAGGLLAGSTAFAGLGAERGAAETEEGLRVDVREFTEEYIAVEVWFPDGFFDGVEFPDDVFLGHADQFVVHEDGEWVSLPDDTEGLATPVEMDFENPHDAIAYFRTGDVDPTDPQFEEVTLGLGVFTERTVPGDQWDRCPGHRDY